jgi:hypothetical protein
MTYDPDHHVVLLWGGFDSVSQISKADLWSWDGTTWAFIHTASSPPADQNAESFPAPVFAYDSQRHLVVLVRNNGFHPAGPRAPDIWTWDGSAWSQAAGANVPLIWGSASYDPAVNGILVFGVDGHMAPQTWSFSTGTWTKLNSVLAPTFPLDDPPPMIYFSPASSAELVDGSGQVWEWKGGDWHLQTGSAVSEPLRTYSIAFDRTHGQLLLLGASTYTWDGKTWTRAR